MRFDSLAKKLRRYDPALRVTRQSTRSVTGVTEDSRKVKKGTIFVAITGARADGRMFIPDALRSGAAGLVVEQELPEYDDVPQIVTDQPRRALAFLAAILRGEPSRSLRMVGVTGTNGKTTTTWLLREILEACGVPCGLVGTVENVVGSEHRKASLTTPSAGDLQDLFADMVGAGCQACIMEVSSHALAQDRVAGVAFEAALFTNLTRDHLDYHGDFESNFAAKARLFEGLDPEACTAIVNGDDEWGRRLAERVEAPCASFGFGDSAAFRITGLEMGVTGMRFKMCVQGRDEILESPLTGRYNAQNIAGAVAIALGMGVDFHGIAKAVANFRGAPGRLERVGDIPDAPAVFVDYAHTPDALENVLSTVREVCKGRELTCVVGCGGDRDRTKRPKMAEIAARLADRPVFTSDNPRSEDPAAILAEMLAGVPPQKLPMETLLDRREAIRLAISGARRDGVVVIAGKGHEDYQIFSNRTVHFDDREEAAIALRTHWGASSSGTPRAVVSNT